MGKKNGEQLFEWQIMIYHNLLSTLSLPFCTLKKAQDEDANDKDYRNNCWDNNDDDMSSPHITFSCKTKYILLLSCVTLQIQIFFTS